MRGHYFLLQVDCCTLQDMSSVLVRQRPVDLYGGGSPFPVKQNYFFGKKSTEIIYFFLYCSEIIFCEVSHILYFLDDSLFKCQSITPLLNWFKTISTYAAQLFFFTRLRAKLFFLVKIGAKIFFSQKR